LSAVAAHKHGLENPKGQYGMDLYPEHQYYWLQLTVLSLSILSIPAGKRRWAARKVPSWLNCFAPDKPVRAKPFPSCLCKLSEFPFRIPLSKSIYQFKKTDFK